MRNSNWVPLGLLLMVAQPAVAQDTGEIRIDSATERTSLTPRVNSAAYFPYSGAYLRGHLTVDLTLRYEWGSNGLLVFKSQDLEDQISAVNHMQTGLLRTVQLWDDVAVLLGAGYIFAQTESFRDPDGSDYFTAGVVSWKPTDWLGVENTALFFDMSASMKLVNRLLLSGQVRGFGVDLYLWERVEFDEDRAATSAALAVTLPTTRLNETMSLKTTLTYLGYLSHTKPAFAQRNGFVLSLAAPMSFKHAPLS